VRGKSSILNALVGQEILTTGPLHGVTRTIKGVNWQLSSDDTFPNLERLTLNLVQVVSAQVQLLDTPGIDEVDGQTREILACQVAQAGGFNPFYHLR
jgi:ribosome biogenesis GTPase A